MIIKQRTYLKHWAARIICLIVLPVLVYMSFFKIHFLSKFSSALFLSLIHIMSTGTED
jgi:dolichyl-phosphate-mannose--protein O-mannosyl transferase